MDRVVIPFRERMFDLVFLFFFIINIFFITYIVDLEQLVIPAVKGFTYPVWPPKIFVDLVHWFGGNFDPLLMARPVWWKMTIWIDVIIFGPFYIAALYAFIRGREWIRIPAFIASSMLITNVIIILGEEVCGAHATPHLPLVVALNLPWLLFPIALIIRMALSEHPFTRKK
ncbi:MAG: emopamil-binding family protein [Spirochaetota bacterium]